MRIILSLIAFMLLASCLDEPVKLDHFVSPNGGVFAIRIPDQLQVTPNSFLYDINIQNVETDYSENRTYKLERMNYHPFAKTFPNDQLQYLHFEFYTFPQNIREEAYQYLQKWDQRITNNSTMFKLETTTIFSLCFIQKIPEDKVVTTIFHRQHKEAKFVKIFDNLTLFNNTLKPIFAAKSPC